MCTIVFNDTFSRTFTSHFPRIWNEKVFDKWSYRIDSHSLNSPIRAFDLYQRYSLPIGISCGLFAARKEIYKHRDHFPILA